MNPHPSIRLKPQRYVQALKRRLAAFALNEPTAPDQSLVSLCRHYLDKATSDNNDDIQTNGELRIIRERLPSCKVVFDIGANVGNWAAIALTINPLLELHCFEPSTDTFHRLKSRKFSPTVYCHNLGLGARPETLELHLFAKESGLNSLYKRRGLEDGYNLKTQSSSENVRVTTLDTFAESNPIVTIDYAKIDVEGHELEVMKGALRTLKAGKITALQFEYGGCNIDSRVLLADIFSFFAPLPYTLHKIHFDRIQRIDRYDQRLETFQHSNWIAIRAASI